MIAAGPLDQFKVCWAGPAAPAILLCEVGVNSVGAAASAAAPLPADHSLAVQAAEKPAWSTEALAGAPVGPILNLPPDQQHATCCCIDQWFEAQQVMPQL